jgi:hypothetical protein
VGGRGSSFVSSFGAATAAADLGKNPSLKEIEDMRRSLGRQAFLYGKWRKTSSTLEDFAGRREVPTSLLLEGRIRFRHRADDRLARNFLSSATSSRIRGRRVPRARRCDARLFIRRPALRACRRPDRGSAEFRRDACDSPADARATVAAIAFERAANPFAADAASLREIVDFGAKFPM